MNIDVYTASGTKKGTVLLPASLFDAPINEGLMHQAVVRQQCNARVPIAHAKSRGEIRGSTRKLFAQKGTGRARRGSVRSPLLRGGGKAFGPRSNANFTKDMPRVMRRKALVSCLSLQAKEGKILGLESYPNAIKTKDVVALLTKLPVDLGRPILFVTTEKHDALVFSGRNVPGVKTITAAYLNPVDVLGAHAIIFLVDALRKAEEVFGEKKETKEMKEKEEANDQKDVKANKAVKDEKDSSSAKASENKGDSKATKTTKATPKKKTARTSTTHS